MSDAEIFSLYQTCDTVALLEALLPKVGYWVRRMLKCTNQWDNPDWHEELVGVGTETLIPSINRHIHKQFSCGEHFVNRVRLDVKKAIRKAYRGMRAPVLPTLEAVRKRRKRGLPEYKPYDPVRRVELWHGPDESEGDAFPYANCDERFLSPHSAELDKYRDFAFRVCEAAIAESQKLGWDFVEIMYAQELTVIGVARQIKTPRAVIRERLEQLSWRIAASASSELDTLGREILGFTWIAAQVIGRVGHWNNRGGCSGSAGNAA